VVKHRNNFTFLVIDNTNIKVLQTSEVAETLASLNVRFLNVVSLEVTEKCATFVSFVCFLLNIKQHDNHEKSIFSFQFGDNS
jgi:hypothetical protein